MFQYILLSFLSLFNVSPISLWKRRSTDSPNTIVNLTERVTERGSSSTTYPNTILSGINRYLVYNSPERKQHFVRIYPPTYPLYFDHYFFGGF